MDKKSAGELVAEKFSRLMNATTSPAGVAGDPPIAAAATAVFLVAYLGTRQAGAPEIVQMILLPLVALPTVIAIVIALSLLGTRSRVVSWLAGLPFPVENLNAVLNGMGDSLELDFADSIPETPAFNMLLDAVSADSFVTESNERTVVLRIGVVDSKRNPAASNHRRYRRVVELIERVLVPLHATHPIEAARVR